LAIIRQLSYLAWLQAALIAAVIFLQPAAGHAQSNAGSSTITLRISGSITAELIGQVRATIAKVSGDPIPAGLIVLLNSPGGDGLAAVEIGRLLRQARAHIFVTDKCASACVFIFMGGVVRQAPNGSLGIHQARITRIDPKTQKRINVDHQRDLKAKSRLQESDQQIRAYVQEMGILAQFSAAMNEIPADQMRWLSQAEGKNLGVIGFDREYLEARKTFVAKRLGTHPGDVERFTERVLQRCLADARKPSGDFARCYRLSLN
jgi:membrane-bound ClpP family serine protease